MPQYELLTNRWRRRDSEGNTHIHRKGDVIELPEQDAAHYLKGNARVPSLKPVESKKTSGEEDKGSKGEQADDGGDEKKSRRVSSA